MHPLRRAVSYRHIFSTVSYIAGTENYWAKGDFTFRLRQCLLKELGLSLDEKALEINENPFMLAGYSITAFFENLKIIWIMFLMMSIFSIPIMYIYSTTGNDYSKHDF